MSVVPDAETLACPACGGVERVSYSASRRSPDGGSSLSICACPALVSLLARRARGCHEGVRFTID